MVNAFFFLLIAFIYSTAGFGGGSMYLALLSQFGLSASMVRFTGLACNAVVTAQGSFNFSRAGWISWRQLLPILFCSVPTCVLAASLHVEEKTYFIVLGFCLLLAGVGMIFRKKETADDVNAKNQWWLYPVGALIGFVSGLTGIGGGVYLSPLLHLTGWGSSKKIAAASSVFILVNSLAGIITHVLVHGIEMHEDMIMLLVAVLIGGFAGSRMGSSVLSQNTVKYLTIFIIIFASLRILAKNL
jgi:uncharacterized protein